MESIHKPVTKRLMLEEIKDNSRRNIVFIASDYIFTFSLLSMPTYYFTEEGNKPHKISAILSLFRVL